MCRRNRSNGFTLVEVLVSLVIFMIASMGLLPLLVTNLQVNHGNSLRTQAQRLAGEMMAELQVVDYTGLGLLADETLLVAGFELKRQIEQNMSLANQSKITVTVRWQQRDRSHRYRLQTIRSAP